MIAEEDLIQGGIYEVTALNFSAAIWTGQVFRGPRMHYGDLQFWEEYPYWESLPQGTCKPLRLLSQQVLHKPFDGVNLLKLMKALNDSVETVNDLKREQNAS